MVLLLAAIPAYAMHPGSSADLSIGRLRIVTASSADGVDTIELSARMNNADCGEYTDLVATLSDPPSWMEVVDGDLAFGDVGADSRATATDTMTVRFPSTDKANFRAWLRGTRTWTWAGTELDQLAVDLVEVLLEEQVTSIEQDVEAGTAVVTGFVTTCPDAGAGDIWGPGTGSLNFLPMRIDSLSCESRVDGSGLWDVEAWLSAVTIPEVYTCAMLTADGG